MSHTPSKNFLLQIFSLDIATIYQLFLVVVNINADRGQQIGRHNLDAVVIGLGVVDINCHALQSLFDHLGSLRRQFAGVLEHGVGLFAGDDRFDGGNFCILASDDRARLSSGVQ